MKPYLLKFLVCPVDHQELLLRIFSQKKRELSPEHGDQIASRGFNLAEFEVEIEHGVLLNPRKKFAFPIYNGVPRLLVFEHPLLKVFRSEFIQECATLAQEGFQFPNNQSVPGETSVLKSFSREWTDYGFSQDAYWGQTAETYNSSLFATLHNENQELKHKVVIEVGIGSGGSAEEMARRFECNLIGVDLGYSVDVAYKYFGASPFLHIVQASVFNLPFQDERFDFVYSHGVIHHTHNTKKAFEKLSRLACKGGRLYIWVYSHINEARTLNRKLIMLLETLIRPWCSRLPGWLQTIVLQPIVPLYIFHQNATVDQQPGKAKYSWREALHAARDRFTPLYIHRHSEEEVSAWFKSGGFSKIKALSGKELPDFVPVGFYMNTGVEGFKL